MNKQFDYVNTKIQQISESFDLMDHKFAISDRTLSIIFKLLRI